MDIDDKPGMVFARDQVRALLGAVRSLTLPEIYESIPLSEGAVRKAIWRLVGCGEVERLERGAYRIKPAPTPLKLPVSDSSFISPIPKHRLMAGR